MNKLSFTLILFIVAFVYSFTVSNSHAQTSGSFKDSSDGKTYRWVKIGNQIWMAENLRKSGGGYKDLNAYGRFYDWKTAKRVCPSGWHLPSDSEWKVLEQTLGMSKSDLNVSGTRDSGSVGKKLKSKSGWRNGYFGVVGNGTDDYGFHAVPGGYYQYYSKRFMLYGSQIVFWCSTPYDGKSAWVRILDSSDTGIDRTDFYKVHNAYVRCVKNN